MKKRTLIYAGCILLLVVSFFLFAILRGEKPRYLTLEIPMPQSFPRYADEYAQREEFSTLVSNEGFGVYHHYFVYRMYVAVFLGEQGFETKNDVENYYDEWLKKLGWQEEQVDLCDPYMKEFQPEKTYRAYVYPDRHYDRPIACLVTWFEFGDVEYLDVLIKTVNPSKDVLSD